MKCPGAVDAVFAPGGPDPRASVRWVLILAAALGIEQLSGLLALYFSERVRLAAGFRFHVARLADRILVMDGGHIVEQGTHEELVTAGGLYSRMWEAQASWYVTEGGVLP